jgi:hypothetical protein
VGYIIDVLSGTGISDGAIDALAEPTPATLAMAALPVTVRNLRRDGFIRIGLYRIGLKRQTIVYDFSLIVYTVATVSEDRSIAILKLFVIP